MKAMLSGVAAAALLAAPAAQAQEEAVFRPSGRRDRDAAMNQAAKAQEPSMEEILASIRRIISDEDNPNKSDAPAAKPAAPPPPPRQEAPKPAAPREPAVIQDDIDAVLAAAPREAEPEPAEQEEADILELTDEMAVAESAPAFRTIDGQPDVIFTETVEEEEPAPAPMPRHDPAPMSRSPLMSTAAAEAVDSAFNQLAQSVFTQNGRTIEDLVRDMLRPMLKNWLDDNLPGLVERLVRAEIERVSRGRG